MVNKNQSIKLNNYLDNLQNCSSQNYKELNKFQVTRNDLIPKTYNEDQFLKSEKLLEISKLKLNQDNVYPNNLKTDFSPMNRSYLILNSEIKEKKNNSVNNVICLKCKTSLTSINSFNEFNDFSNLKITENNSKRVFKDTYFEKKELLENSLDKEIQKIKKIYEKKTPMLLPSAMIKTLQGTLLKFLFNQPILKEDIQSLNLTEKTLLRLFLIKKKVFKESDPAELILNPKQIFQRRSTKRVEENLKLVFKKGIRFLKNNFKKFFGNSLNKYLKSEFQNYCNLNDYAFYGFYFNNSAERLNFRIEKFFEPGILNRKYKNTSKNLKLTPKTISKVYINCIKMSELFIRHLKIYTNYIIIPEMVISIKSKTNLMILTWKNLITTIGNEQAIKTVNTTFKSSERCKLAWSVKDIKIAIEQAESFLKED